VTDRKVKGGEEEVERESRSRSVMTEQPRLFDGLCVCAWCEVCDVMIEGIGRGRKKTTVEGKGRQVLARGRMSPKASSKRPSGQRRLFALVVCDDETVIK
jgi:hypothetical protein